MGYNPNNLFRSSRARYFLPDVDEWYKSAYFDPSSGSYFDYPTGSNAAPVAVVSGTAPGTAVYNQPSVVEPADVFSSGGLSPYGTMAQGGNAWEWEETATDLTNDSAIETRGERGGSKASAGALLSSQIRFSDEPTDSLATKGFRVASLAIPEPSTIFLSGLAAVGLLLRRRTLHHISAN